MKPRLLVKILPWVAQVKRHTAGVALLAEGVGLNGPNDITLAVGEQLWCFGVIGMDVVNQFSGEIGNGFGPEPDVLPVNGAGSGINFR